MWQPVNDLIRWAFWLWFGHQQNAIERGAKSSNGGDVAAKVCHDDAIQNDFAIGICTEYPPCFHRDLSDAVQQSVERNVLEINEGSIRAAYRGNAASNARNRFNDGGLVGFIGHDGVPWVWEASKGCWLPVTESSRASEYAALQEPALMRFPRL